MYCPSLSTGTANTPAAPLRSSSRASWVISVWSPCSWAAWVPVYHQLPRVPSPVPVAMRAAALPLPPALITEEMS